jgi:hypothetical protein
MRHRVNLLHPSNLLPVNEGTNCRKHHFTFEHELESVRRAFLDQFLGTLDPMMICHSNSSHDYRRLRVESHRLCDARPIESPTQIVSIQVDRKSLVGDTLPFLKWQS